MREIKFRAWDSDKKEMIYLEDNTTRNNSVMECQIVFDELGHYVSVRYYGEDSWFEIKNTKLMQYTGLKDKNGKEIFEGDIVKDKSFIGVIEYRDNIASFIVKINDSTLECLHWSPLNEGNINRPANLEYTEVIGNIYDNPELLEVATK